MGTLLLLIQVNRSMRKGTRCTTATATFLKETAGPRLQELTAKELAWFSQANLLCSQEMTGNCLGT